MSITFGPISSSIIKLSQGTFGYLYRPAIMNKFVEVYIPQNEGAICIGGGGGIHFSEWDSVKDIGVIPFTGEIKLSAILGSLDGVARV